jgi:flagellar assembly protein FliH
MINLFHRNFDTETELVAAQIEDDALVDLGQSSVSRNGHSLDEVEGMLARARAAAFSEGRAAGIAEGRAQEQDSRETGVAYALDLIQSHLVELTRQDESRRREIEAEMIKLALGIGERIVPDLMATCAIDQLSARIRAGLRMATCNDEIVIWIAPSIKDSVAERIADFGTTGASRLRVKILSDPAMPDSAVRLEWRNGFMEYDLGRACEEVLDALRNPVE